MGGRAIGWAEWGPEHGTPVLFCPGAATSCSLGFGAHLLADLGVRLVALDRPGLGASDPAPARTLATWADDVAELIALRNLRAPRIVGHSQGAPFALACAHLVERVAIVSGTDELASRSMRTLLVPDVAALVDRVAADPNGAEAFFSGMTPAMMRGMVLAACSAADREVFTERAFEAAWMQALDEGFSRGPAGYARDTVLAFGRWPFDPARIRTPVELWYGAGDTSPVHSPDFGSTLATRIPGARRHLLADGGGALLWTHAGPILEALVL